MPLLRVGPNLIHFIHIPKTAGSTMKAYMLQKGSLAMVHKNRMGWSRSTAQHIQADIHEKLLPDGFVDHSFAILRDPTERLISEYSYRMKNRPEKRKLSLNKWLGQMRKRYAGNPYAGDNHLRPQIEFLRPNTQVFSIGHGLEPVFDWLDKVTETPSGERDIRKNRSPSRKVEISEEAHAFVAEFYTQDVKIFEEINAAPAGVLLKDDWTRPQI